MSSRGDRIEQEAHVHGDYRKRCDHGHVFCEHCGGCACITEEELDSTSYPNRVFRVIRDKQFRSLCRECRYQSDKMFNF